MTNTVPVHITSTDVKTERRSAEYGSWQTYAISSTWQPNQILKRNLRRRRAVIVVQPSVGGAQPATDGVILGTQAQVSGNQASGLGGFLQVGFNVTVENQQEVWAAFPTANTDAVKVLVLDELYEVNADIPKDEYDAEDNVDGT